MLISNHSITFPDGKHCRVTNNYDWHSKSRYLMINSFGFEAGVKIPFTPLEITKLGLWLIYKAWFPSLYQEWKDPTSADGCLNKIEGE